MTYNFAEFSKSPCNVSKCRKNITKTENSRKNKIAQISISREKRKLTKCLFTELKKKRIFKLPKLSNSQK